MVFKLYICENFPNTYSMNKLLIISAASLTLAFTACRNSSSSSDGAIADNGEIHSFEVSQNIKTSSCTYQISGMPDSCHITLSASITWPERIGGYDIHLLQDSILRRAFPPYAGHDVNDAIKQYISQPDALFDNDSTLQFKSVESVSENINSYTADVSVSMLEITLDYVTYRTDYASYLGGAHPLWGSDCFTYTYNPAQVLTLSTLFTPGYDKTLLPILSQAIADEISVSPAELKSMLLTDSIYVSDIVYLYNGMIVFHYNPYALLPYAYGAIDAKVAPYEVNDILTPHARTLLLSEE